MAPRVALPDIDSTTNISTDDPITLTLTAPIVRASSLDMLDASAEAAGALDIDATITGLVSAGGVIDTAGQTQALAAQGSGNVTLVPAFTGLGAPWWDADARGAIFGMTRATGPNEIARAALEAVCYQTCDLLSAMHDDWGKSNDDTVLRVDGGMVASDWTMQYLSDILDSPVDRPTVLETTALGAAWLAGSRAGVWGDRDAFAQTWNRERRFEPQMDDETRNERLAAWNDAVQRTLSTPSQ